MRKKIGGVVEQIKRGVGCFIKDFISVLVQLLTCDCNTPDRSSIFTHCTNGPQCVCSKKLHKLIKTKRESKKNALTKTGRNRDVIT